MKVDHVLDKLYKQVESDDDDFCNLKRSKVIHDEYTLQMLKWWLNTPRNVVAKERFYNEYRKSKSKKSHLTNHNRSRRRSNPITTRGKRVL